MVLLASHKQALQQMGYTARDVAEIGLALDAGEFTYQNCATDKRISEKSAIAKLGIRSFLSGIGRACFHASAVRGEGEDPKNHVFIKRV